MYDKQRTATFVTCLTTILYTPSYSILQLLLSNGNLKGNSGNAIMLLFCIPQKYLLIEVEYSIMIYYSTPVWSSKLDGTNVAIVSHFPTFVKLFVINFGNYSKSFALLHVPSKVRENWSSNCKF
jgi:hypothetical protein